MSYSEYYRKPDKDVQNEYPHIPDPGGFIEKILPFFKNCSCAKRKIWLNKWVAWAYMKVYLIRNQIKLLIKDWF